MHHKSVVCFYLLITIVFCGCGSADNRDLDLVVSILPQEYIVKQIGGGKAKVGAFVRPGESPATYQPSPRQMIQAGESQVYFTIGVPFEKRFVSRIRASFPEMKIVDMARGIDRHRIEAMDFEGHDHDHSHNGSHDPHVWLSPPHLKHMAENTCSTLVAIDPDNSDFYREKLRDFQDRADSIDKLIKDKLRPFKGKTVYVYHPAFGYFLREYGLKQKAVEAGGKSPSPGQLIDLIENARSEGVRVIFVQPQFDPSSAEVVAEAIDGNVVLMDPLEYNVLDNLLRMADQIESAMK